MMALLFEIILHWQRQIRFVNWCHTLSVKYLIWFDCVIKDCYQFYQLGSRCVGAWNTYIQVWCLSVAFVNDEMADSYPKPFSNKIELDKNKVLGRGNSVVYRGSYERHPVAVKRIVVDTLSKEDREVKTQVRLDHDNVLKILTVEQDADFR
jgi:hypothetical protein